PTESGFLEISSGGHDPSGSDAGRKPKGDSVKSPAKKSAPVVSTPDVLVANAGTVFTFCPLTARGKLWIEENVETEGWQWLGATLVVEQRYASGLAQGLVDAGLVLR